MCYFCYAQLFEITHLTNIKSTLVQHSCRNAEVVEAFCRVAASRSNTRRSIHQPSVAALHAPAEMPTALSSILRYQTLHVASCPRRAYHRERPALNPHSARCLAGAQLPATSCLGAFRPPATSSCGGSRDPGVRKPAQERTIAPSVFWSAQLALRKSGSRPNQGLVRATKLYACVAYPAFFPLKNALYAELLRYPSRN